MKKFFKNNIKPIITFILGLIVSGGGVYAATIIFQSDQVGFDNANAGITLNNQSVDNVQDAIDAIYTKVNTDLNTCQTDLATAQAAIPPTCSNSPFQVGDYIDMTPTATTFTPDTTYTGYNSTPSAINPSELNVWRVIKVNSDCTVEVVSEYVSSVNVYFRDKTGYMNYIWYLNEIAKQYANTTYTLNPSTAPDGAFRNVGYDSSQQTAKITDSSAIDNQTLGASGGAGYQTLLPSENKGGGDSGFGADMDLLNKARVNMRAYKANTTTFTYYWLASRLFYWDYSSSWYFNARFVNNNGVVGNYHLYYWVNGSFSANDYGYAVRPIVTLKSGLTTSSGNGTSSSHYQLSVS